MEAGVRAGVEADSWKPVKPVLAVVAAGAAKLKLEANAEEAGGAEKRLLAGGGG